MASTFTELVLLAQSASGTLQCAKYNIQDGWSPEVSPTGATVSSFALASFAGETKIMLAFADSSHDVHSCVRSSSGSASEWEAAVPVPAACTDGGIALGVLGASLYLIVKAPDSQEMNVISYNTAKFNVVTVPPALAPVVLPDKDADAEPPRGQQDNTTINAWSPSAFPVAHFSSRPDNTGEREPSTRAHRTSGPMAVATLDGVMHLVRPGTGNPLLMTETFSIAGVLTPSNDISYIREGALMNSDGFGTLAEAGWSKLTPISEVCCESGGALAMGRAGNQILLLCREQAGSALQLYEGRYVQKNGRA